MVQNSASITPDLCDVYMPGLLRKLGGVLPKAKYIRACRIM